MKVCSQRSCLLPATWVVMWRTGRKIETCARHAKVARERFADVGIVADAREIETETK